MNIADGKWTGGSVPFGFRLQDGDLAIVEERVEVVRRIFDEAAAGRSPGEIAAGLRADGINRPTKKFPKGREWNSTTVKSMIQNERYRGVRVFHDQEYQMKHGAIVSKELWELANARLPETAPAVRNLTKHDYAFVGIGTCGVCGQPLAGYPGKGRKQTYDFYTCRRARKRLGGETCQLGHIRVEQLESLVIQALAALGKHPDVIQATVDAAAGKETPEAKKRQSKLDEVLARLEEIRKETVWIDQIVQDKKRPALAERMLDKAERLLVEEKRLKDEKRILELTLQHEQEKAFNREAIAEGLSNLGRVIGALPGEQRRELLRLLVRRIVVKPWNGEKPEISGETIAIAPEFGTKRYSVKIWLFVKEWGHAAENQQTCPLQ